MEDQRVVNHSKEELDKQRIWLVKLCSDKPKWVKELADFVHSNRPLVAKGQTFCVEVIEEALEIANATRVQVLSDSRPFACRCSTSDGG